MTLSSPLCSSILRFGDARRMRWKNGAGWTSEIMRVPDGDDWDWRMSIAEIEADAPFSTFPGVDRELVLLDGNGLRLRFEDGAVHEVLPPHGRLRFAGERGARAELLDGPTRDFNLMWKRDAVAATLLHRPLVGPMVFFAEPRVTWLVHLMQGQAQFKDLKRPLRLAQGDSVLLLPDPDGPSRLILDGGGEALLVKIESRA